ncbi:DUF4429 domain-containing protein [Streptomyces sp. NPDC086519]|uniref:DUF4429 domain-containing protein n=1 Tax=Streptomyces sp. NPDC086519 TaxID=3154863 RepID=UPI00341DD69D
MDNREVKGALGTIAFDGKWITITKKGLGFRPAPVRIRAADVISTRLKRGNRFNNGYVQFLLSGSSAAGEHQGLNVVHRPSYEDPHSLSFRYKANDAMEKLVAAVEQARG